MTVFLFCSRADVPVAARTAGLFTDNNATFADSRDATAPDCRDCPVTDNENATPADRRDTTAADRRNATPADRRDTSAADRRDATAADRRDAAAVDLWMVQLLIRMLQLLAVGKAHLLIIKMLHLP